MPRYIDTTGRIRHTGEGWWQQFHMRRWHYFAYAEYEDESRLLLSLCGAHSLSIARLDRKPSGPACRKCQRLHSQLASKWRDLNG